MANSSEAAHARVNDPFYHANMEEEQGLVLGCNVGCRIATRSFCMAIVSQLDIPEMYNVQLAGLCFSQRIDIYAL